MKCSIPNVSISFFDEKCREFAITNKKLMDAQLESEKGCRWIL